MVREIKIEPITYGENGVKYYEFAGLHLDTKPKDGVATGSLFREVDTGDLYAYDEEGEEWNKIAGMGG